LKTEFSGKYFNGVTSGSYPCRIRLGGNSFDIHLLDESGGETDVVRWDPLQISKTDVEFNHKTVLKYGSFPPQMVQVEDRQFAEALRWLYPYCAFAKRDVIAAASGKWKWVVAGFLALAGFAVFAFWVLVPNAAEYASDKIPLSIEEAIGESAYGQLTALSTEDVAASRLVQEFFDSIPVPRNYDYTVTVLDSEDRNAFAVPGGRIAIYSGILEDMKTPEELAALLLHESAHVELRHSLKSLLRTLSGYFLISLLFGDAGGITAVVFENIYVFKDLQYSREMEREADMTGLQNMQRAGFNPEGMIDLFRSIEENSPALPDKYELTEFMSTHPLTGHRIEYIRQYIAEDTVHYATPPVADSLFGELKQALGRDVGE
jgi:Zn-dependent protease with chaperone function